MGRNEGRLFEGLWRGEGGKVGLPSAEVRHSWTCHSRGVDLVRVEYVPDDRADIAATVARLRERVGPKGGSAACLRAC